MEKRGFVITSDELIYYKDRIVINCDFNSDCNIKDKSYLINVLKSRGKNK